MFCPNCNQELPESMRFCMYCGAEITASGEAAASQEPEAPVQQPPMDLNVEGNMPQETPNKKDPQKRKLMVRIIAGVTALAVVVVCLLGFFAWDWGLYIRNMVEQTKPAEEYKDLVESRALSASSSSEFGVVKNAAMSYYTNLTQTPAKNNGASMGAKIMVGDGLKDLLQLAGDENELLELVQALDVVDLRVDAVVEDGVIEGLVDLGLNEESLLALQLIMDMDNGMMYMDIPGLTDAALEVDLEELGLDADMVDAYSQSLQASQDLQANLPSAEDVSALYDRCLLAAMEQITQVEKDSGTIEADGVEQNVTVLTYEVNEQTAVDMAIAVLSELEDDATVMALLEAYTTYAEDLNEMVGQQTYPILNADDAMDAITDAINELEEYDAEDESVLIIETYVDKKGQIVGRSIMPENEEGEITYMTVTSGNKIGFKAMVDADGTSVLLEGSGTERLNHLTGVYTLEVDGSEMVIVELEDFNDETNTGVIRLSLGDEVQEAMEDELGSAAMIISTDLVLELTLEEESATLWLLMDDEQILGMGLYYQLKENATVDIPSNTTADMEQWAASLDSEELLSRLEDAGITEEMLEAVMAAIEDLG